VLHFDKLPVEGIKSFCEIAAGSGVGFGVRTVGCIMSLGIALQALNAIEVSAQAALG
jgi:hypothetical protein